MSGTEERKSGPRFPRVAGPMKTKGMNENAIPPWAIYGLLGLLPEPNQFLEPSFKALHLLPLPGF